MNEFLNIEFSGLSLLIVIMLGILLSFALKIINKTIIPKIQKNRTKQFFQIAEILIWSVFGFWGLHITLKDSDYYFLAVISVTAVIVIWLGWFMAKDFIAGFVLKLGDNYQPGQHIMLNEIEGVIVKADYLNLILSCEDGAVAKIPYSKISSAIHYKIQPRDKTTLHRFDIEIKKKASIEEAKNMIKNAIMLSSGASIKKEPQINLKENSDETIWKFEVVAYALSPEFFQAIERNVRDAFS
ncbi:MAG: mechanosensitive ion channel family protein [Proteobacteria bacterium]|nr:mechanosensitive ion channel family protein [Pseudomonadota bacterium]